MEKHKDIKPAQGCRHLGAVNIPVFPSVLKKLRAWEQLVTSLSFEALESEGLLPEGATHEGFKKSQDNLASAPFSPVEVVLGDYLENISRQDFIRGCLELGMGNIGYRERTIKNG